ncbi:hypothetical protein K466DRAFT_568987 [Polyporus arcularius HHB13444]|uniref:Uncharacterized protein n=1 Tax=Polyporus arcularius HHB13444 TaxID=1314778 RepID=A0A5C3NXJ1_9APHY|nr:hypothetical protein K466DRAFT_568987 [Polyporus arcularius HHB13444]
MFVEELQKGPSRISGPASVYVLNGTLKDVFVRMSYDGEYVCQSVSLEVPPNLTLHIYVEDTVPDDVAVHTCLRVASRISSKVMQILVFVSVAIGDRRHVPTSNREPEWSMFVENRKRALTAREQLWQYHYVQGVLNRFVGQITPPDLPFEGTKAISITKTQVMRAFNLPLSWAEQCAEVLALTALYGPGGARGESPRVVKALDDPPAVTSKFTTERYLKLLREVHRRWTMNDSS